MLTLPKTLDITEELVNLPAYSSTQQAIDSCIPDVPMYLFRPHAVVANCQLFNQYFSGRILYAIKANDDPILLKLLIAQGIRSFDVASLYEVELMHEICPDATLFFMNPVKYSSAIHKAYHQFGVRNFSLDSEQELHKILDATNNANDLHLFVRIFVSNESSVIDLSTKFGIHANESFSLLEKVHQYANKVSLCFHVGSQCKAPETYINALDVVKKLINTLPFKITAIDIGGGFPANYEGNTISPLEVCLKSLQEPLRSFPDNISLLAEPGRALVASGHSLVTKVLGRKKNNLFISDGIYGGLFEPCDAIPFPAIAYSGITHKKLSNQKNTFQLWGPSCDGDDKLKCSFNLPDNIDLGDYIEFGHAGAYSRVFRNNFNGFYAFKQVHVKDDVF